jgi:poly-gamma-glutamate synthesis protein (capsule biosynthesis protein)
LKQNIKEIEGELEHCDIRIGNWESPLWGDGGMDMKKEPRLCTTLNAAKSFLSLKIDVALLANNHIYDCLEEGYRETINFFKVNGIKYLGAGLNEFEAQKPLIIDINDTKLGLLNYVGPETHPNNLKDVGLYINLLDKNRMIKEIKELTDLVDIVVVNLHWGQELVRYPSIDQRSLARHAIESGAKVVACHHSHCLQGHEKYKEGHIFYSLGNFIFGGLKGREMCHWSEISRRSAAATCVVSKARVEDVTMQYFYQNGFTLVPDRSPKCEKIQQNLNMKLKMNDRKYNWVYYKELYFQWVLLSSFRFIRSSGGLINAIRRFRWKHLVALYGILTGKK